MSRAAAAICNSSVLPCASRIENSKEWGLNQLINVMRIPSPPIPPGGRVHSQSTKPQPYPTLKSPTHPKTLDQSSAMGSSPHYRLQYDWWVGEEEEEEEVVVDEEEEEEMDDAERKEIEAILNDHWATMQRTARERMTMWAKRCEYAKKRGSPNPPPLEMFDYPDLFERAWGWDMILPHDSVNPWSRYKEYLREYYIHNQKEANAAGDLNFNADDNGNGLAALAHSCIKMEEHLLFLWDQCAGEFPTDGDRIRRMSDKITKHAREMINVLEFEFPAAAVALKCIAKEAELMCDWLIFGTCTSIVFIRMSNEIRRFALSFMIYKGPEYVVAAAAMMGITKEAKVMCQFLRKELKDKNGDNLRSFFIRNCTLGAMYVIHDECSAAEDSTGGSTAGEFICDESDDKNCSEKKLVKKDNLEERNNINQNTKDESNYKNCSMKDLVKEDSLVETNETKQNTKIGSELEGVKKDNPRERSETRQKATLQEWLKISDDEDDEEFDGEKNLADEDDEGFDWKNNLSEENNDDKKNSSNKDDDEKKNSSRSEHKKQIRNTGCFGCLKPRGRVNEAASSDV
ncbi:uncharacterized protein LOC133923902 isoform X2 [Phragmites australis]|uniref:uncharacterized protein LOC133923902 isoform X2 n=1 Tax=Phragmites australis TaxID=29695 RepID=UPI002D77F90B|nr:uncharacterized protein LOC133923902 isoform X2 [Phragmites australis]